MLQTLKQNSTMARLLAVNLIYKVTPGYGLMKDSNISDQRVTVILLKNQKAN
jgi:hypothetical protein